MANPEHLSKLKEGVAAWNKWRVENPDVEPDLSVANLRGAYLSETILNGAILSGVDLSGANLRSAYLSETILDEANLSGADLSGANFRGAQLFYIDLRWAVLIDADLSGAVIRGADFSGADLTDADLFEASFYDVTLIDTILNGSSIGFTIFSKSKILTTKGIGTMRHVMPSSLCVDTIKLSGGKLPDVFLRGCGFSPWEVELMRLYDPDLTPEDVDKILGTKIYQKRVDGPLFIGGVFISYSQKDSAFADKLYLELQDAGVSVWLDRHDMLAGDINKQVIRQIRIKDIVVLVLSENSIESDWVEMELEEARKKEKDEKRDVLCPVTVDDCWKSVGGPLWRKLRRDKNILDFSAWEAEAAFEEQFDKLIKGMQLNY